MPNFSNVHSELDNSELHHPKDFSIADEDTLLGKNLNDELQWFATYWQRPIINFVDATQPPPPALHGDRYVLRGPITNVDSTVVSGTAISGTVVSTTALSTTAVSSTVMSSTVVSSTAVSGTAVDSSGDTGTEVTLPDIEWGDAEFNDIVEFYGVDNDGKVLNEWRNITPEEGYRVHNKKDDYVYYFDGAKWQVDQASGNISIIHLTYEEAAALKAAGELRTGSKYYLTDRDILIEAVAVDQFSLEGEHTREIFAYGYIEVDTSAGYGFNNESGPDTPNMASSADVAVGSTVSIPQEDQGGQNLLTPIIFDIKVAGQSIMGSPVALEEDLYEAMEDVAFSIEEYKTSPDYIGVGLGNRLIIATDEIAPTEANGLKITVESEGLIITTSPFEHGQEIGENWFRIKYDFDNDFILEMRDDKNNIVRITQEKVIAFELNPMELFPWGHDNVFSNQLENSFLIAYSATGEISGNVMRNGSGILAGGYTGEAISHNVLNDHSYMQVSASSSLIQGNLLKTNAVVIAYQNEGGLRANEIDVSLLFANKATTSIDGNKLIYGCTLAADGFAGDHCNLNFLLGGSTLYIADAVGEISRNQLFESTINAYQYNGPEIKENYLFADSFVQLNESKYMFNNNVVDVPYLNCIWNTQDISRQIINHSNSTLEVIFDVDANAIDFSIDGNNFVGVVSINTSGKIDAIDNLSYAPQEFIIKPEPGQTVTFNSQTAVNITLPVGTNFITLDGTLNEYVRLRQLPGQTGAVIEHCQKQYVETTYLGASTWKAAGELNPGVKYFLADKNIILEAVSTSEFAVRGAHTREIKAVGYVELTGGTSGSVDEIRVDGVNIMNSFVNFNTDLETTAGQVVEDINGFVSNPNYTARQAGSRIIIFPGSDLGSSVNGYLVVSSASAITTVDAKLNGGQDVGDKWFEIDYDFDNDFIARMSDDRNNEVCMTPGVLIALPENPIDAFPWGNSFVSNNKVYDGILTAYTAESYVFQNEVKGIGQLNADGFQANPVEFDACANNVVINGSQLFATQAQNIVDNNYLTNGSILNGTRTLGTIEDNTLDDGTLSAIEFLGSLGSNELVLNGELTVDGASGNVDQNRISQGGVVDLTNSSCNFYNNRVEQNSTLTATGASGEISTNQVMQNSVFSLDDFHGANVYTNIVNEAAVFTAVGSTADAEINSNTITFSNVDIDYLSGGSFASNEVKNSATIVAQSISGEVSGNKVDASTLTLNGFSGTFFQWNEITGQSSINMTGATSDFTHNVISQGCIVSGLAAAGEVGYNNLKHNSIFTFDSFHGIAVSSNVLEQSATLIVTGTTGDAYVADNRIFSSDMDLTGLLGASITDNELFDTSVFNAQGASGFIYGNKLSSSMLLAAGSTSEQISRNIVTQGSELNANGYSGSSCIYNIVDSGATLDIENSSGDVLSNTVRKSTVVDLSNTNFQVLNLDAIVPINSLIFNSSPKDSLISENESTYNVSVAIDTTANSIDFDQDYVRFAGILTVTNSGELVEFLNLDKAPKEFIIIPDTGKLVTFNPDNLLNIDLPQTSETIVIDGSKDEFIRFRKNSFGNDVLSVDIVSNQLKAATIKEVKLTLTSAQILALNSNPIQVVAAPGSGYAIEVTAASVSLNYNSATYTGNTNLVLRNPSGSPQAETSLLAQGSSRISKMQLAGSSADDMVIENEKLEAYVETGNPSTGDSEVILYVTYRLVEL